MFLQEVYIGKNPKLLEAEKCISNIRKSSKFKIGKSYDFTVGNSKDIDKFNRLMEDVFGFGVFELDLIPRAIQNAYTLPLCYAIDVAPQFRIRANSIVDSSGIRYKGEANYVCCMAMYQGLFFDERFTDEEIMAIILHEIGHNFETVISNKCFYLSDASIMALYLLQLILSPVGYINVIATMVGSSNIFKYLDVKVTEYIKDNMPILSTMISVVNSFFGLLDDAKLNVFYVLNLAAIYGSIPRKVIYKLMMRVIMPVNNWSEQAADIFSTTYGYGPALSSALIKMETGDLGVLTIKALKSNKVTSNLYDIYMLPVDIIVGAFDEHPDTIIRAKDQLNYLRKDLDSGTLSPAMQSRISKDIKEIESTLDQYLDLSKDYNQKHALRVMYWGILYKLSGGSMSASSADVAKDINNKFKNVRLK